MEVGNLICAWLAGLLAGCRLPAGEAKEPRGLRATETGLWRQFQINALTTSPFAADDEAIAARVFADVTPHARQSGDRGTSTLIDLALICPASRRAGATAQARA